MTSQVEQTLQRYFFRRQFIVGPEPYIMNEYWDSQPLMHGQYLSIHDDLPFVSRKSGSILITIIGVAIDPFRPEITEETIAEELLEQISDVASLIEATNILSGRWVMIFQNSEDTYVFTDPTGHRTVYYFELGDRLWFGSQPEIINHVTHLNFRKDKALISFLRSEKFRQSESAWVGNQTIYENCLILIPNHYLQFFPAKTERFFPAKAFKKDKTKEEILGDAATIMKGTMKAIANRYEVMQSITAGYDSRALLAASKDVKDKIELFVERNGSLPASHPDVRVPQQICKKLDLNFRILNSTGKLPGWFTHLLSKNITNARILTKTNSIFHKLYEKTNYVYLGGNIGELFRNPYSNHLNSNSSLTNAQQLAGAIGYDDEPYVIQELIAWIDELDQIGDLSLGEIFYWEQRLSNWGAQYPSEQDIAAEELRPFNNRLLIENLLSIKGHSTADYGNELFKELISEMWSELLAFPFNPIHKDLSYWIKKIIPRLFIERIRTKGAI
ncbi:MAG TPA: hypothetical protein VE868_09680 [Balneolaceae bacterium]|nr:hypothetical protein [Balneolaceae bacterium]